MTRNELVKAISKCADVSKKEADKFLDCFIKITKITMGKGESVSLFGFGKFDVSQREARTGRNPQIGAKIHIPARKVPTFRAGKGLKDALN